MNDKILMEDILSSTKGACELYMHGTIESGTANVHSTFDRALDDSLQMQNNIFNKMSQKGWYQTEQVDQQKIMKVKQSFSQS